MSRLTNSKGSSKGNDGQNRYENSFVRRTVDKDRHIILRLFVLDVTALLMPNLQAYNSHKAHKDSADL
jgi:hypothetical protein